MTPMPAPFAVDAARLRADLVAADYSVDEVLARIGDLGQEGLGRNCTVPADVALGDARDPLATLIRLFLLQQPVPAVDLAGVLDTTALAAAGYLALADGDATARIDIRPYGSPDDGASGWLVADPTPGLDHVVSPTTCWAPPRRRRRSPRSPCAPRSAPRSTWARAAASSPSTSPGTRAASSERTSTPGPWSWPRSPRR
jgi:hypothetical protein